MRSRDVEGLFPLGVIAAELRTPGDPALLLEAEAIYVRNAVPERISEFAAGRTCARQVLAELGVRGIPLKVKRDRSPDWPKEAVGSITHTSGYCCAVAGTSKRFQALGLDAEETSIPNDLYSYFCTSPESSWLEKLSGFDRQKAATLIFSAKEAFYKFQYTLTGEVLDFKDVTLDINISDLERGVCAITPSCEASIFRYLEEPITGRFAFYGKLVITGFALLRNC